MIPLRILNSTPQGGLWSERTVMTQSQRHEGGRIVCLSSPSRKLATALTLSCVACFHRANGFAFLPRTSSVVGFGGGRQSFSIAEMTGIRQTHVCDGGGGAARWAGGEWTNTCGNGRQQRRSRRSQQRPHPCTSSSTTPSAKMDLGNDAVSVYDQEDSGLDETTELVEGADVVTTENQDETDEEREEEIDGDEESDETDLLPRKTKRFLDGTGRGQMLDVDKILTETEYLEQDDIPEGFRTGFVTIMGSPNVGKSTLMNSLIGDRLSIVTPKAGTTRHRISGIMTGDDFQMIYQDTPGVLNPKYMLHEGMMTFVTEAMGDADCILFMTDIFEKEFSSPQVFERMLATEKPIVVAVNKVDLLPSDGRQGDGNARQGSLSPVRQAEVGLLADIISVWEERLPGAKVVPISALDGINTQKLAGYLKEFIPEGPPLFGSDVMSDRPTRFFAGEIIREQIFGSFSQEIPYSCEVRLDNFKERKSEIVIDATIVVSQDSQKGMVIGKGGAKIKDVGIKARHALEDYLQTRVNLRLNVKVDKNWRKNKISLKAYGYLS